jgi:hypothetical protein
MIGRGRAALVVLACLGGVLLVSWATVGGPVRMPEVSLGGSSTPAATASPSSSPTVQRPPHRQHRPQHRPVTKPSVDLSWIRYVVLGGLGVMLLVWLARRVPRLVLRIWRDLPDDDVDEPATGPVGELRTAEVAAAIAADRAAQLAAVDGGTPRNGVVAAWSRLEEIAAVSGLPRHRWETSAEFTGRMLAGLPVEVRSTEELGRMYRLGRFSSHELTEADRDTARRALTTLHDELLGAHR